jgi:hypothetical protein
MPVLPAVSRAITAFAAEPVGGRVQSADACPGNERQYKIARQMGKRRMGCKVFSLVLTSRARQRGGTGFVAVTTRSFAATTVKTALAVWKEHNGTARCKSF